MDTWGGWGHLEVSGDRLWASGVHGDCFTDIWGVWGPSGHLGDVVALWGCLGTLCGQLVLWDCCVDVWGAWGPSVDAWEMWGPFLDVSRSWGIT